MKDLSEHEIQVMEIDERLRPIATRPVDRACPRMSYSSKRFHFRGRFTVKFSKKL